MGVKRLNPILSEELKRGLRDEYTKSELVEYFIVPSLRREYPIVDNEKIKSAFKKYKEKVKIYGKYLAKSIYSNHDPARAEQLFAQHRNGNNMEALPPDVAFNMATILGVTLKYLYGHE